MLNCTTSNSGNESIVQSGEAGCRGGACAQQLAFLARLRGLAATAPSQAATHTDASASSASSRQPGSDPSIDHALGAGVMAEVLFVSGVRAALRCCGRGVEMQALGPLVRMAALVSEEAACRIATALPPAFAAVETPSHQQRPSTDGDAVCDAARRSSVCLSFAHLMLPLVQAVVHRALTESGCSLDGDGDGDGDGDVSQLADLWSAHTQTRAQRRDLCLTRIIQHLEGADQHRRQHIAAMAWAELKEVEVLLSWRVHHKDEDVWSRLLAAPLLDLLSVAGVSRDAAAAVQNLPLLKAFVPLWQLPASGECIHVCVCACMHACVCVRVHLGTETLVLLCCRELRT